MSGTVLRQVLEARLTPRSQDWFRSASAEIAAGVPSARFSALIALASRHARDSVSLAPSASERGHAERALEGWNIQRWTLLETLRVALVVARGDLDGDGGARAIEEAFHYADEGELRALYRSLALLPGAERFAWRAAEGCRTNMRSVFEAIALDTPFPYRWFDEVAWRSAAIKCVFVGAPLWRLFGLDRRLSSELARMALDLADERRSAGRPVQHELWLCLGAHGGKRAVEALLQELDAANPNTLGRRAAAYGLARAGEIEHLQRLARSERDSLVCAAMADALAGRTAATRFALLDPTAEN